MPTVLQSFAPTLIKGPELRTSSLNAYNFVPLGLLLCHFLIVLLCLLW